MTICRGAKGSELVVATIAVALILLLWILSRI